MNFNLITIFTVTLLLSFALKGAESSNLESDNWRVTVGSPVPCAECLARHKLQVEVVSTANGNISNYEIDGNVTEVTNLQLMDTVLAVVGNLPFGGQSVSIFNLANQEKVSEFYGYDLHTSPDSRYIIYRKYFPRMATSHDSIVMLFDMMEAFAQNKSFISNIRPEDIGIPIFPSQARSLNEVINYEGVPSFSLTQVIFNTENDEAVFSSPDENGNISLVRIPLWQPEFTDSFDVCFIPLIEGMLQSDLYTRPVRNTVEQIVHDQDSNITSVFLYNTRGISTIFRTDLNVACQNVC